MSYNCQALGSNDPTGAVHVPVVPRMQVAFESSSCRRFRRDWQCGPGFRGRHRPGKGNACRPGKHTPTLPRSAAVAAFPLRFLLVEPAEERHRVVVTHTDDRVIITLVDPVPSCSWASSIPSPASSLAVFLGLGLVATRLDKPSELPYGDLMRRQVERPGDLDQMLRLLVVKPLAIEIRETASPACRSGPWSNPSGTRRARSAPSSCPGSW